MNRQKKLQQKFNKKLKRAKAKRFPKNKERYISKAERALLEQEAELTEKNNGIETDTEIEEPVSETK